jgi:hypothetical protein
MKDFMVANLLEKPELSIWDLAKPGAEEHYVDWQGRIESLTYRFDSDCSDVFTWVDENHLHFSDLFVSTDNKGPILERMAIQRYIHLETLVVFNKMLDFMHCPPEGVMGGERVHMYWTVAKYSYFVDCNIPKLKAMVKRKIESEYRCIAA